MEKKNYQEIIEELQSLPSGGITYKKINGKEYAYYQWREEGKQRARRAKEDELPMLMMQIERRKELENLMKGVGNGKDKAVFLKYPFHCMIKVKEELADYVKFVAGWKKRECYKYIEEYLYEDEREKVFILYGLRRTGKTTLMRQAIYHMDESTREKTAYIQIKENNNIDELYYDLRDLERAGYKYVFIDEVTLLEDFIQNAAMVSDLFATCGMKIVLSGTDSLSFIMAKAEQLFDRCILCHTSFISYREFEQTLGLCGIDKFICYGGTMCPSGEKYNKEINVFGSKQMVDEYVDSAIAHNIQHSLKYYQYGTHFRSLKDLFEANELTSAINRIVEDMNHQFTVETLTKNFKSSDLSLSRKNLRKDRTSPTEILDLVDAEQIAERLKQRLEIKNKPEQTVEIDIDHCEQIKEYLDLLDLTVEIRHIWMQNLNRKDSRTVFTQPGLRYAQAKSLIDSLLEDEIFQDLSLDEQEYVSERILSEIKGRMMEDIILLETIMARPKCQIFCLKFAVGEYDMVVFDRANKCCEIFEIKHSTEIVPEQRQFLLNEEMCERTAFRYGRIKGKYVIYRGEETEVDGVKYLNVEEYLRRL